MTRLVIYGHTHKVRSQHVFGFTIVELLVVIVVIGVLAAITIVSYTGVSQKAVAASLQSDLSNASRRLKMFNIDNSAYPPANNCAQANSSTNYCYGRSMRLRRQPANTTARAVTTNSDATPVVASSVGTRSVAMP